MGNEHCCVLELQASFTNVSVIQNSKQENIEPSLPQLSHSVKKKHDSVIPRLGLKPVNIISNEDCQPGTERSVFSDFFEIFFDKTN